MNHLTFFTGFTVLYLLASVSYADEKSNIIQTSTSVAGSFIIPTYHLNQQFVFHDATQSINDSVFTFAAQPKIQGKYTTGIMSIETGLIQTESTSNWQQYYFTGAISLHQKNAFNLSLTASIEQFKDGDLNYYQTPILDNKHKTIATELNYSYGLIGSYSVNSTWHFSGGFIHSPTTNNTNDLIIYRNKQMALVGTTYSF